MWLSLVFFQVFLPSPCMNCFVLLMMGLSPMLLDFSLWDSSLCGHLQDCCLLFGLQSFCFFFPMFLCWVFFLYLFIYSFDEIIDLCKAKRGNYWLQKPHLTLQPDLIDYKRVRNPREPKILCCSFSFRNSLELRFYFNLNAFIYGNA